MRSLDLTAPGASEAFHDGVAARQQGKALGSNPHDRIATATSWAVGWHSCGDSIPGWLACQARRAGLLPAEEEPAELEEDGVGNPHAQQP
jgi:hypothetical protein